MEQTATLNEVKKEKTRHHFFSKPLFVQSFKATWALWLALTLGSAFIFIVINATIGSKNVFTNIDMKAVAAYVDQEGLQWLKILGLLEHMGFSLSRIEIMTRIDLNSILNELVYKIAGVLLPMIYVILISNKLICSQVNDGSMAYVLSTPTNRKRVVRTQFAYFVLSLILMYIVIAVSAFASEGVAHVWARIQNPDAEFRWAPLATLTLCFSSFCAMFALAGIAFGASAWFNKTSYSLMVGGGIAVTSFLCCILGLFGNQVFVAVGIGVREMNLFNYLSLFTLIDGDAISEFAKASIGVGTAKYNLNWLWKDAILLAIGTIFTYVGSYRFLKKDLPL